jgi:hypothetical protein
MTDCGARRGQRSSVIGMFAHTLRTFNEITRPGCLPFAALWPQESIGGRLSVPAPVFALPGSQRRKFRKGMTA